jgi:GNAT superfamily N-acetyltransferase
VAYGPSAPGPSGSEASRVGPSDARRSDVEPSASDTCREMDVLDPADVAASSSPAGAHEPASIAATAGDGRDDLSYGLRRPDTPAEWTAYYLIRRDVLLESREFALENAGKDDELAPQHYPLLFWYGRQPIGTIRVDSLGNGFAALRLVAIDPVCQCQGHGLRLLEAAERFARGISCRMAVVYATLDSVGFYARAGYEEGSWDDCCVGGIVQMVKPLR